MRHSKGIWALGHSALEGHLGTRALGHSRHSRHSGTQGTWALGHSRHLRHLGTQGNWALGHLRHSKGTWALGHPRRLDTLALRHLGTRKALGHSSTRALGHSGNQGTRGTIFSRLGKLGFIPTQYSYSTSILETSENVCFYLMTGSP